MGGITERGGNQSSKRSHILHKAAQLVMTASKWRSNEIWFHSTSAALCCAAEGHSV